MLNTGDETSSLMQSHGHIQLVDVASGDRDNNKTQGYEVICAGCKRRFNRKNNNNCYMIRAEIMTDEKYFCFHDEYCIVSCIFHLFSISYNVYYVICVSDIKEIERKYQDICIK